MDSPNSPTTTVLRSQLFVPPLQYGILAQTLNEDMKTTEQTVCVDNPQWTSSSGKSCMDYSILGSDCSDTGTNGTTATEACRVACNNCPANIKLMKGDGDTHDRLPSPVEETYEPSYSSLLKDSHWKIGETKDISRNPEIYNKLDDINEKLDELRKNIPKPYCSCNDVKDNLFSPYRCAGADLSDDFTWSSTPYEHGNPDSVDTDVRYEVGCKNNYDYMNEYLGGHTLLYNCTSQKWETKGPNRLDPYVDFRFPDGLIHCGPPAKRLCKKKCTLPGKTDIANILDCDPDILEFEQYLHDHLGKVDNWSLYNSGVPDCTFTDDHPGLPAAVFPIISATNPFISKQVPLCPGVAKKGDVLNLTYMGKNYHFKCDPMKKLDSPKATKEACNHKSEKKCLKASGCGWCIDKNFNSTCSQISDKPSDCSKGWKISSAKASSDKASSAKEASDKVASDKVASDKVSSDKVASDKAATAKASSDKTIMWVVLLILSVVIGIMIHRSGGNVQIYVGILVSLGIAYLLKDSIEGIGGGKKKRKRLKPMCYKNWFLRIFNHKNCVKVPDDDDDKKKPVGMIEVGVWITLMILSIVFGYLIYDAGGSIPIYVGLVMFLTTIYIILRFSL